jgi:hypothetical protein
VADARNGELAGTTATYAAPRTATSRRARLRWPRSELAEAGLKKTWQGSQITARRRGAEHTMSEEGMEEERRWSGDFVPVAIYSSVIFVLLVLYVRYL